MDQALAGYKSAYHGLDATESPAIRDISKEFPNNNGTASTFLFAEPYSAWERSTDNNMEGLPRRYFKNARGFGAVTQKTLAEAVKKLNHPPCKCPDHRTNH